MPGLDAGDALDVYSGDGGVEVEVEALLVDPLLGWNDGGVGEVLVDGADDTGEFEDRRDLDQVSGLKGKKYDVWSLL